jgi:hypothetical protein
MFAVRINKKPLNIKGFLFLFVGVAGFEPATSCSQSRRDEPGYATPRSIKELSFVGDANVGKKITICYFNENIF